MLMVTKHNIGRFYLRYKCMVKREVLGLTGIRAVCEVELSMGLNPV
jgi:hypothetical protein